MQLLSKFNEEISFLLFVIDTYSKYGWVISLRDKENVFQLSMIFKTY